MEWNRRALAARAGVDRKPVHRRSLGKGFELPKELWSKLNLVWAAFFFLSGAANLYVAYNYAEETWVNFRMFGMTGLSVVFVVANLVWIVRVAPPPDDESDADTDVAEPTSDEVRIKE